MFDRDPTGCSLFMADEAGPNGRVSVDVLPANTQ